MKPMGMGAGMAQAAPPKGGMSPNGEEPDDGPAPNVSPDEQAAYDQFVQNGASIIEPQQGQVSPAVMANLQGQYDEGTQQVFQNADPPISQSPIDALAVATVSIVLALEASAAQANHPIDPDVVRAGGEELMERLADIAQAANIHDFSEQEQENALYRAVDLYRVTSSNVDPEQAKQGFEQIAQADRAGTLDQVLPGIGQRMQQAQQQPPQGQQAQPQQGA